MLSVEWSVCSVCGLGFRGLCSMFWVYGLGFRVWDVGVGVKCLVFGVEGFGRRIEGLGLRIIG